jgi:hypothetical protein
MPNDGGIVNSVKSMTPFTQLDPLTEAELDRLGDFLDYHADHLLSSSPARS